MNAALLVIPVIYQIMTIGDHEAAEKVMEEVFSRQRSTVQPSTRNGANKISMENQVSSHAYVRRSEVFMVKNLCICTLSV